MLKKILCFLVGHKYEPVFIEVLTGKGKYYAEGNQCERCLYLVGVSMSGEGDEGLLQ